MVEGVLTSAIEFRPLTAAELASPNVRAGVERCERVGEGRCREGKQPKDRRTRFTAGIDPKMAAMFASTRLTPGAAYLTDCRLLDPAGSVVSSSPDEVPVVVPPTVGPETTLNTVCVFHLPPGMPAGRWAVEFAINGQPVRTLWFDVLAGPSAGGATI